MNLVVRGIQSGEVDRIRCGGADANGQPALTRIAEGVANPCRHCLDHFDCAIASRCVEHQQQPDQRFLSAARRDAQHLQRVVVQVGRRASQRFQPAN